MKKYAVIVAGGTGSRMNSSTPKQFLYLEGKPILYYSIARFLEAFSDIHIIIVLPEEYINKGEDVINTYFEDKKIDIAIGGNSRFQSVKNGLSKIKEEAVIFIHDAARCLISNDLLLRCYQAVLEHDAVIPVINVADSLRWVSNESNSPLDRNHIKLVQTPQVFKSALLLPAFEVEYNEVFTDEATVVESMGYQIHLIEGETTNIKITNPIDIIVAEKIMQEKGR